jgi:hypothetical protein
MGSAFLASDGDNSSNGSTSLLIYLYYSWDGPPFLRLFISLNNYSYYSSNDIWLSLFLYAGN